MIRDYEKAAMVKLINVLSQFLINYYIFNAHDGPVHTINVKVACKCSNGLKNMTESDVLTDKWKIFIEFKNGDSLLIDYDENIDMTFKYRVYGIGPYTFSIHDEFLDFFYESELTEYLINWLSEYVINKLDSEPFTIGDC